VLDGVGDDDDPEHEDEPAHGLCGAAPGGSHRSRSLDEVLLADGGLVLDQQSMKMGRTRLRLRSGRWNETALKFESGSLSFKSEPARFENNGLLYSPGQPGQPGPGPGRWSPERGGDALANAAGAGCQRGAAGRTIPTQRNKRHRRELHVNKESHRILNR